MKLISVVAIEALISEEGTGYRFTYVCKQTNRAASCHHSNCHHKDKEAFLIAFPQDWSSVVVLRMLSASSVLTWFPRCPDWFSKLPGLRTTSAPQFSSRLLANDSSFGPSGLRLWTMYAYALPMSVFIHGDRSFIRTITFPR